MNIAEWISHYRWQGALHFYLIDNGSTDDWKSKLNMTGDTTVVTRLEPHQQQQHYDSYLPTLRENHKCDWALVVDLDEYVYAKPPTKGLASFFASVSPFTDQIKIPWKMFGSSGFNLQPESVRCSFTERSKTFNTRFTKTTIRIKEIDAFKVHRHQLKSSLSSKLTSLFFNREVLLDNLEGALQINHYAIQSREYFERVKLHRGDVYWPDKNDIRTWEYFENYDKAGSGYKDHELCSLLNCCNTTKIE
ncbi:hypothetical protein TrLO_g6174 [Triparma laevis f. longispina]|uniref:Glycosyltransferase family 92 protein n=1 Tax=Triparma laevis f. longispina TaxID=1714387 RepID=A0A9W7CEH4_9STRA|nr:hypothetical protein TrLO_g6174 [Triparma laevis f. longispina]